MTDNKTIPIGDPYKLTVEIPVENKIDYNITGDIKNQWGQSLVRLFLLKNDDSYTLEIDYSPHASWLTLFKFELTDDKETITEITREIVSRLKTFFTEGYNEHNFFNYYDQE